MQRALVWLIVGFSCCGGAEALTQEVKKPNRVEALRKFGSIPVEFNGRVTDYQNIARVYLERVAGTSTPKSGLPASIKEAGDLHWLLDVIADGQKKWTYPIIPIDPSILPESLQKRNEHRYSVSELIPHLDSIQKGVEADREKNPQSYAKKRQAVIELSYRLRQLQELVASHITDASAQLLTRRLDFGTESNIPFVIPPVSNELGRWKPLLLAKVDTIKKKVEHAEVVMIESILLSHRTGNLENFSAAVNKYSTYLEQRKIRKPLQFKTPSSWRELSNPYSKKLDYFGDVRGEGLPIASFQSKADKPCNGGLALVRSPRATLEQIINHHRFMAGWLPLTDEEVKRAVKRIPVAKAEAFYYEIDDSPSHGGGNKAIFAHFFIGGLSWTVSLYGDKSVVDLEKPAFHEFSKSLVIEQDHFRNLVSQRRSNQLPYNGLVTCIYVIPHAKQTLVLILYTNRNKRETMEAQVQTALRSLKMPIQAEDKPLTKRLGWSLPKTWSAAGDAIYFLDKSTTQLECRVFDGLANDAMQIQMVDTIAALVRPQKIQQAGKSIDLGKLSVKRWVIED